MKAARPGRPARAGSLILAALALAGCGDPALWARWKSERALFHLRALEHRIVASGAPEAERLRLEEGYGALLEAYPPERWAAWGGGAAREVALAAGTAGLSRARSEASRGAHAAAERDLASLEPRVARLPGVLLGARLARLAALERLGRFDDAGLEREAIAGMDPLAEGGEAAQPVLDAAMQLVAERRALGEEAGAASAIAHAEASFTAALARADSAQADPLAEALSQVRAARGDAAGALASLRARLLRASPGGVPDRVRAMASRALQAGAPESAIVYSRWASCARRFPARGGTGEADRGAVRSTCSAGRTRRSPATTSCCRAGTIPAASGRSRATGARSCWSATVCGRWRSIEYDALAAIYPTHPLAFLSARQIVQHHLRANEPELARVAGETALENLRRLLRTNRDPSVQRRPRRSRETCCSRSGGYPEAETVMLDLWRRFPGDSTAEAAALRAARLAEHRPGVPLARIPIRAAASIGHDATVRRQARLDSGVAGAR